MLETVIFIGRSGCGKGTQAALLRDYVHLHDVERFRQFVRGETLGSSLSEKIWQHDRRQPDFLACIMWGDMLISELGPNMHLFFDGVCRSKPEAVMLAGALHFYEREHPTVVELEVSRKWSEEKLLKRGRSDDVNLGKIDARLDWFDKDVVPAIDYLKSNPYFKVLKINGEQTIDKVHADIVKHFAK